MIWLPPKKSFLCTDLARPEMPLLAFPAEERGMGKADLLRCMATQLQHETVVNTAAPPSA